MTDTKTRPTTADQWNELYPIGTPVIAFPGTRDSGPALATRTRTVAWALGSGDPVVAVEGYPGGIAMTHLDPIEVGETVAFHHFEMTPQRDGHFAVDCMKCDIGMTVGASFGGIPQATMVSEFVKQHAHQGGK